MTSPGVAIGGTLPPGLTEEEAEEIQVELTKVPQTLSTTLNSLLQELTLTLTAQLLPRLYEMLCCLNRRILSSVTHHSVVPNP